MSGIDAGGRAGALWARRRAANENTQLLTRMTTALFVELEGRVARDLVSDIVKAVLDESRQTAQDRAVEPMMVEARKRLERFIRARQVLLGTGA